MKFTYCSFAIFLIALGINGNYLLSQERKSMNLPAFVMLDSVWVTTPSKSPQEKQHIMRHVEVVDSNTLRHFSGGDFSRLLSVQGGMNMVGAYSNTGSVKSLFLQGASSNTTLVLMDGIPLTDVSGSGAPFDWRFIAPDAIEKIEILKGSQSVLYGSNAVSGVINLITKQAASKAFRLSGGASHESYSTNQYHVMIDGRKNSFSYQASYYRKSTLGISEAQRLPLSDALYNVDGLTQENLSLMLSYKPSEKISVTPFLQFYSIPRGEYDAGAFLDADNSYQSSWIHGGVRASIRFKKYTNMNILYGVDRLERSFDATFFKQRYEGLSHSLDVYVSQGGASWLYCLVGLHAQSQHLLDTALSHTPTTYNINPYVNFNLGKGKRWDAELGARMVYDKQYGVDWVYNLSAGYRVSSGWYVYANHTKAFVAPTLSQLYGQFGANSDLKPQSSYGMNVGTRLRLLNGLVKVEGSFFYRIMYDVIAYTFFNNSSSYRNQDEQTNQGIEMKVNWIPNKKWQIDLWYAYTDGHIRERQASGEDTTYFNLFRQPKHSVGISVVAKPYERLSLSANVNYNGVRLDLFYDPNQFFQPRSVDLGEYVLANFYASYGIVPQQLNLYLRLENLLHTTFTEIYGYATVGSNFTIGIQFNY